MEDREERIAEAYGATFQWIFEDQSREQVKWSSFKEFLRSSAPLYWMTGKAGSGKSTLMKYICHRKYDAGLNSSPGQPPSRCFRFLQDWAQDCTLVIATFFFWNSGMPLQMKQEGLFRTLLVQILGQIPELISSVVPRRWEALCLLDDDPLDWSNLELQDMLRRIIPNLGANTKLCLLVDGLDEFEGNHNELIVLFKELITDPRIKLCVSSRPWVEFEDAFKHAPSLMLQDLTSSDIKHYVSSHMENDPRFDLLRKRELAYASKLVENIVVKSSGVFLWTRIAVASILSGIGHGDRVSDLQTRLDTLPEELEQLYNKILNSLDPFYLEHAAQLFQFIRESPIPPSVLLLSFADDKDNWRKAINHPLSPLIAEDAEILHDTMRRRINSRCKGFLEIQRTQSTTSNQEEDPDWELCTVQYLHRTVKDYIESPDVQSKLESSLRSPYDPHFGHCAGWLAMIRTRAVQLRPFDEDSTIWEQIDRFLYHASRVAHIHYPPLLDLMDELDKTCSSIAKRSAPPASQVGLVAGQWSEEEKILLDIGQWAAFHPYRKTVPISGGHYLSLVVRHGVLPYVQRKVNLKCLLQSIPTSRDVTANPVYPLLLDAITGFVNSRASEIEPRGPDVETIACLLEKGADPNYTRQRSSFGHMALGETVWVTTLNDFAKVLWDYEQPLYMQASWMSVCKLMLENGAGEYSVAERQKAVEALNIYLDQINIFFARVNTGHHRPMTKEDIMRHLKWDRHCKPLQGRLLTWTRGYF